MGGVDRRPGAGELVGRGKRPLRGCSLAEQKTILTGDHHGLIWATGEKHGSGWSWRREDKAFADAKGRRAVHGRTLTFQSVPPSLQTPRPRLFRNPGFAKAFPVKFRSQRSSAAHRAPAASVI